MNRVAIRIGFFILGAAIAVAIVILMVGNPAAFGQYSLFFRACLLNLGIFAAFSALFSLFSLYVRLDHKIFAIFILASSLPAFIIYLAVIPLKAVDEIYLDQLDSSLLSDRSSNGIIEIGFQYPIFTPSISVDNRDAFTRELNIFLRITDIDQEASLFRAVRSKSTDEKLSVESTIRGMLSNNLRYLFNPVRLAPGQSISGRPVFIITNLEDGASFTEALNSGHIGYLELRDPDEGNLLADFKLAPI